MKVLFAGGHGYFPELVGGVEASTDYLVRGLHERNHEAAVFAALFGGGLFGLRHRLALKLGLSSVVRDRAPGYCVYRAWRPWLHAGYVTDHFRPDVAVVQAHNTVPVAEAFEQQKIPVVAYLRNVEFEGLNGDLRDLRGTTYIANSHFTARAFAERYGIESTVIRPMIDRSRYSTTSNGRFVTLVNVHPEKGYEKALALSDACPDVQFLFIEGWPLTASALNRVQRDVAERKNVYFERSTTDMTEVYSRTRILLAPSKWEEAWGRVASEAHCSGIPVIGSNRGGLGEAIGPGGITLDYDAPLTDWADAVRSLWDDKERYDELSAAATAYSKRPELNADAQFDVFMGVLGDAVGRRVAGHVGTRTAAAE